MTLSLSDMFNPFNFSGEPTDLKIAIGGPFGQLYMRLKYLNGSLDKLWLMLVPLFWIPPFSLFPVIWARFGWMKKISGNKGSVLDFGLLLPILAKILLPFLINDESALGMMAQGITIIFVVLTMFFINLWNKRTLIKADGCTDVKTTSVVGRSMGEALFHFSLATLPIYLIGLIPVIGEPFDIITAMPIVGDIVKSGAFIGGYILGYILTKMFAFNFTSKPCDPSYILIGIVGFIAFIVAGFFDFANLIPGLNLIL
jgi:hypothetical protein